MTVRRFPVQGLHFRNYEISPDGAFVAIGYAQHSFGGEPAWIDPQSAALVAYGEAFNAEGKRPPCPAGTVLVHFEAAQGGPPKTLLNVSNIRTVGLEALPSMAAPPGYTPDTTPRY